MVGFIGFIILAAGGGGLALYLGVPPVFIGAYVIGLILIGAITGFGGGGASGSGGGGSTTRSSGGGKSMADKAVDATNGFLDNLDISGSDDSDSSSSSSSRSSSSRSSKPKIVRLRARDVKSGANASDIDIQVAVKDRSGKGLKSIKIEVPGLGGDSAHISGKNYSNTYNLAKDILGSDPSPADDTYDVNLTVKDEKGQTSTSSTQFKVGGSSSSSSSSSSNSNSGGGGPDFSEMFKNMTIGQSQQQQMQQQMQSWMQMYQMQMQQQQMQQMMTPAVMQFGNFLNGRFTVGNGVVVIPGEQGDVEVDIDVMQQLVQVLSQSNKNENYLLSIMSLLMMEGDGSLNQEIINDILNVVYEENKGDITIEQEINRFVNKNRVEMVNNTFINKVENNFNLNQKQENFALQISEFFMAVENTQYDIEGNHVHISIQDFGELEIHYTTLIQLLKAINMIPDKAVESITVQILNQIIVNGSDQKISEEVIREIIMIIKEGDEGNLDSATHITVEDIVLINKNTGEKIPEKMLDNGGLVYRPLAGISGGRVKVNPRAATDGGELQEVIYSLSAQGENRSWQRRVGLNSGNYGYNGEGLTLKDIRGDFKLKQEQQYNLGVTFIAKDGNQVNKVGRIKVSGQGGKGKGEVPAKRDNKTGVPANTSNNGGVPAKRKNGEGGVPANSGGKGGLPANTGSSKVSESDRKAIEPGEEKETQRELEEAGKDISEAEDLTEKALEDAKAGRLPAAEKEAEEAEDDIEEANEDLEESEEEISSMEIEEEKHLEETSELLSQIISEEENLSNSMKSIAENLSNLKTDSGSVYRHILQGKETEKLESLENGDFTDRGSNILKKANTAQNLTKNTWGKVTKAKERLEAELNALNHLNSFLQSIDQDINEEENTEELLKQLAEYSSDQGLEERTEKIIRQRVKLQNQEKQEAQMYQEIRSHLQASFEKVETIEEYSMEAKNAAEEMQTTADNERSNFKNKAESKASNQLTEEIGESEKIISEIDNIVSSQKTLQQQKINALEGLLSELEKFSI